MHYDNEREAMGKQTATEARVKQLNGDIKTHLIDDAIDALSGAFPEFTGSRYDTGCYYVDGHNRLLLSNGAGLGGVVVCKQPEFESRKAERQNKPSWKDAPEWANWLAQDGTGLWVWFMSQPAMSKSLYWVVKGNRYSGASDGGVIGNWQDTLEQRPEVKGDSQADAAAYALKPSDGIFKALLAYSVYRESEKPTKGINPHKKITKEDLAKAGYIFCGDSFGFVQAKSEPAKAEQDWGLDPDDESGFDFEALANQFDNTDDANAVWALRDKLLQKKRKSPELSFHLANASNELQASAKLLDAESHLLQSITGVIGAIQAIREAV